MRLARPTLFDYAAVIFFEPAPEAKEDQEDADFH
jgi:hypothetical protein